MELALFSAAFLHGLAGSWHCPGMCGPIAHVLYSNGGKVCPTTLLYNLGRTLSYFSVGLLLGLTGGLLNTLFLSRLAAVLGGVLIIVFGFAYLFAGGLKGLMRMPDFVVRGLGGLLKQKRGKAPAALLFGMVSGLLPCGLLYPAYALALGTGRPLEGAVAMIFFSLGTYPAMMALGSGSAWFWNKLRQPVFRRVFGVLMIVFGTATIYIRLYVPHDHASHGASHEASHGTSHGEAHGASHDMQPTGHEHHP